MLGDLAAEVRVVFPTLEHVPGVNGVSEGRAVIATNPIHEIAMANKPPTDLPLEEPTKVGPKCNGWGYNRVER